MDLLEDLEVVSRRSTRAKAFQLVESDEEGDFDRVLEPQYGMEQTQVVAVLPAVDIVKQVRKRLGFGLEDTGELEEPGAQVQTQVETQVQTQVRTQVTELQTQVATHIAPDVPEEAVDAHTDVQLDQHLTPVGEPDGELTREEKIQRLIDAKIAKEKEERERKRENSVETGDVAPLFVQDEDVEDAQQVDESDEEAGGVDTTGFAVTSLLKKTSAELSRNNRFSVSAFLEDFDELASDPVTSSLKEKTSPITSPVKSPLRIYHTAGATQLGDHPKQIELDSDSDTDLVVVKEKTSKATRLDVKTHFMKRRTVVRDVSKDKEFLKELNQNAIRQLATLRKDKSGNYINMEELMDQENAVRDLLEEERAASDRLKARERARKARLQEGIDDPDDSDYGSAGSADDESETNEADAENGEDEGEDDPRPLVSYGGDDDDDKPRIDLKDLAASEESAPAPVAEVVEFETQQSQPVSFKTDLLESQNLFAETQIDSLSQKDTATQRIESQDEASESDEEAHEDPEIAAARAQAIREAKQKQEQKRKKRERELRRKGLNTVFEQEAEESEDEWQGFGGADGEMSDQADSEDEKLLDDATKIRLDESAVRRLIAKEDIVNDENMVRKLLEDIKSGKLRKRRAAVGALDLELSDDEEEQVLNLYRSRLNRQREALLNDEKISKLAESEKSKAFFESLLDESPVVAIDMPEVEEENESKDEAEAEEEATDEAEKPKKKRKITQEFVQKTLSFLADEEDDDPDSSMAVEQRRELERIQHGFDDDDETDLRSLKQNSIVNPKRSVVSIEESTQEILEEEDDEVFGMLTKSRVSSIQSFRESMNSSKNDVTLGTKTVSASTAYRAASGSRASVTSLGRSTGPKLVRSLKAAQIEKSLKGIRKQSSGLKKLLDSNGFN